MKNKKSIYFLLPLVLVIWGLLIYKFVTYRTSIPDVPTFQPDLTQRPIQLAEHDTFSINTDYRDPFLGKLYKTSELRRSTDQTIKQKVSQKIDVWPDVRYKGIVSDVKSKKRIFLVVVNGRNNMMQIGQTKDEVMLKSGDSKEVVLVYKKNVKRIKINE
jgi:hypothetical protein